MLRCTRGCEERKLCSYVAGTHFQSTAANTWGKRCTRFSETENVISPDCARPLFITLHHRKAIWRGERSIELLQMWPLCLQGGGGGVPIQVSYKTLVNLIPPQHLTENLMQDNTQLCPACGSMKLGQRGHHGLFSDMCWGEFTTSQ